MVEGGRHAIGRQDPWIMSKSQGPDKVIDFKAFGDKPARGRATALYIGNKNDARNEAGLHERGITHILNCTPPRSLDPESGCPNFFEASHRGWVYKRIPIFDNRGEDILSFMPGAVAFIEQGKHYGSVLVHCNKGVSRSASFVLGYLMHAGGLSLTDALELLRAKRKACAPNESFWEQLRQWEARVVERRRARGEKEARYGVGPEVHGKGGEEGREGGKGLVAGPSLPPHLQAQRKGGRSVEPATMEGEVPVSKRLKAALPIGPSRPPAAGGASPPSVPKTGSSPSSTPLPADPSAPPSSSPLLDSPPSLSKSPSPQDSSRKHDRMGRIGPALPPGHLANAGTGGHDGGH